MYELLKTFMNSAETIGRIEEAHLYKKSKFYGDRIVISGKTAEGVDFTVNIEIGKPADKGESE